MSYQKMKAFQTKYGIYPARYVPKAAENHYISKPLNKQTNITNGQNSIIAEKGKLNSAIKNVRRAAKTSNIINNKSKVQSGGDLDMSTQDLFNNNLVKEYLARGKYKQTADSSYTGNNDNLKNELENVQKQFDTYGDNSFNSYVQNYMKEQNRLKNQNMDAGISHLISNKNMQQQLQANGLAQGGVGEYANTANRNAYLSQVANNNYQSNSQLNDMYQSYLSDMQAKDMEAQGEITNIKRSYADLDVNRYKEIIQNSMDNETLESLAKQINESEMTSADKNYLMNYINSFYIKDEGGSSGTSENPITQPIVERTAYQKFTDPKSTETNTWGVNRESSEGDRATYKKMIIENIDSIINQISDNDTKFKANLILNECLQDDKYFTAVNILQNGFDKDGNPNKIAMSKWANAFYSKSFNYKNMDGVEFNNFVSLMEDARDGAIPVGSIIQSPMSSLSSRKTYHMYVGNGVFVQLNNSKLQKQGVFNFKDSSLYFPKNYKMK